LQAPQKSPSDRRSTQSIPHCVKPGLQLTPQVPFTHDALPAPVIGGAHVSPQPPQFCGFAVVSTQIPPHNAKPSLHAAPHVPLWQTALPFDGAGHTVAQPPQLVAFDCMSTHASPHLVLFAGQSAAHVPSTHTIPMSQVVSQLPQCDGSFDVFTHESPQRA
jgi:hypothetical protein